MIAIKLALFALFISVFATCAKASDDYDIQNKDAAPSEVPSDQNPSAAGKESILVGKEGDELQEGEDLQRRVKRSPWGFRVRRVSIRRVSIRRVSIRRVGFPPYGVRRVGFPPYGVRRVGFPPYGVRRVGFPPYRVRRVGFPHFGGK